MKATTKLLMFTYVFNIMQDKFCIFLKCHYL